MNYRKKNIKKQIWGLMKMKYGNYFLLSLLLWFPPIHELGHVIICHLIGSTVNSVNWWGIVYCTTTPYDWVHTIWEQSVVIPLIILIYVIYLDVKSWSKQKGKTGGQDNEKA